MNPISTKLFRFSQPINRPARIIDTRNEIANNLPEDSYFRLQANQKRCLTYGLAQTINGKRILGFGQYLFGAGHRGIFSIINQFHEPIDQILAGGEILVSINQYGKITPIKANHTSGFLYRSMMNPSPFFSNDLNKMKEALESIKLFDSTNTQFNEWTIGQSNRVKPNVEQFINLRHDLENLMSHWNFYSSSKHSLQKEEVQFYLCNLDLQPSLQSVLDVFIDVMRNYLLEFPDEQNQLNELYIETINLCKNSFSSPEKLKQFLETLLKNIDNPNHPSILHFAAIQEFLESVFATNMQPDKLGYDLFEIVL